MAERHTFQSLSKYFQWAKNSECLLWTGYRDDLGYGVLRYHGKAWKAHRLLFSFFVQKIPENLSVLHRCDIRNCINPDHLWLGTQEENMADCANKKRTGRRKNINGELNPNHKLTSKKILEMRRIREEHKLPYYKIAKLFQISTMTAFRAITGKSWKQM